MAIKLQRNFPRLGCWNCVVISTEKTGKTDYLSQTGILLLQMHSLLDRIGRQMEQETS
jgi:hypothetical protein